MPCVSLVGVARVCGPNPGGVKTKIYLARVSDVESIPAAANGIITADIVMKTGKAMVIWEIELDSGNVPVETEGSISGPSIKANPVFKMARNNPTTDLAVQQALGQELIALFPKNSGQMQLIGSLDKGAFLGFKQGDGLKSADFAGKDLALTWEGLSEMPYYYTGDVPLVAAA